MIHLDTQTSRRARSTSFRLFLIPHLSPCRIQFYIIQNFSCVWHYPLLIHCRCHPWALLYEKKELKLIMSCKSRAESRKKSELHLHSSFMRLVRRWKLRSLMHNSVIKSAEVESFDLEYSLMLDTKVDQSHLGHICKPFEVNRFSCPPSSRIISIIDILIFTSPTTKATELRYYKAS